MVPHYEATLLPVAKDVGVLGHCNGVHVDVQALSAIGRGSEVSQQRAGGLER